MTDYSHADPRYWPPQTRRWENVPVVLRGSYGPLVTMGTTCARCGHGLGYHQAANGPCKLIDCECTLFAYDAPNAPAPDVDTGFDMAGVYRVAMGGEAAAASERTESSIPRTAMDVLADPPRLFPFTDLRDEALADLRDQLEDARAERDRYIARCKQLEAKLDAVREVLR